MNRTMITILRVVILGIVSAILALPETIVLFNCLIASTALSNWLAMIITGISFIVQTMITYLVVYVALSNL